MKWSPFYTLSHTGLVTRKLDCCMQTSIGHATKGITVFKIFISGGILSDIQSNLVLSRRASGAIKRDFRAYIQQYTSQIENFEYV